MLTINTIFKELKSVPLSRLEELYQIVQSMSPTVAKNADIKRKEILSYGGAFSEMSNDDFMEFQQHTVETRSALFNRTTS